jgi:chemotaxis protein methyltransferase CheR
MSWTPAYDAVVQLVARRTGLRFSTRHQDHTEQAIRRGMERNRIASLERYCEKLTTDEAALDDLVGELTVSETYFFREPGQFDFIRREVLADLRQCRGSSHIFRVWSAGCATGEEAYSLAILFAQEAPGSRTHLLATDISRVALARAQQATYNRWSLRGTGAALAKPYLIQSGNRFTLNESIRRRVRFEYLNLAQDVYPSLTSGAWSMDLILCRNVLIYLDPETVARVAHRLYQSLAPGGWLIAASSDPPLQEQAPFATVMTDAGVFYRRPDALCRVQGETSALSTPPLPSPLHRTLDVPSDAEWSGMTTRDGATEDGAKELPLPSTPHSSAVEQVRALAVENVAEAERACAAALARQPLNAELHYWQAALRMDLGQDEEAVQSLRRVIYLDRSLAVAHFTLGALLWRQGDQAGARGAYRNAFALCSARPADEHVPLADGECAGRLARSAAFHLALLDAGEETIS